MHTQGQWGRGCVRTQKNLTKAFEDTIVVMDYFGNGERIFSYCSNCYERTIEQTMVPNLASTFQQLLFAHSD